MAPTPDPTTSAPTVDPTADPTSAPNVAPTVDPCKVPDICKPNSFCESHQTESGYKCTCKPGYGGNGKIKCHGKHYFSVCVFFSSTNLDLKKSHYKHKNWGPKKTVTLSFVEKMSP